MIVKDKSLIIEKANNSSWDAMQLIVDSSSEINCEDDPAEYIYYLAHSMAFTLINSYKIMEAYSKIYGIELDFNKAKEWIDEIVNESINLRDKK